VWPNLVALAESLRIPTALLSATLPAGSSRLRWPARVTLAKAHARLSAVGAISMGDASRYARLGVSAERLRVIGDARFDQVWERAARVDLARPELGRLGKIAGPTLVAGSTWPEDEARLIRAVVRSRRSDIRLILVPHEPSLRAMFGP
jgi:3-deoxy-D-manno-octulosonic-acid transferase